MIEVFFPYKWRLGQVRHWLLGDRSRALGENPSGDPETIPGGFLARLRQQWPAGLFLGALVREERRWRYRWVWVSDVFEENEVIPYGERKK